MALGMHIPVLAETSGASSDGRGNDLSVLNVHSSIRRHSIAVYIRWKTVMKEKRKPSDMTLNKLPTTNVRVKHHGRPIA